MDWRALLLRPTAATTTLPTRHAIPAKSKQSVSVRQSKDEATGGYKNQKTSISGGSIVDAQHEAITPLPLEYKPSDLFVQSAEEDIALLPTSSSSASPQPLAVAATPSIQYPKSIALRIARASRLLRIALHQCTQTLSRWAVDKSSTIATTKHFAPDVFYKPSQAAERFQHQWLNTTMCLHEQDAALWTQHFTHMYTFHYLLYRKWCRVQAHLQQSLIAPPPHQPSSSSQSSSLNRARQRQTLGEIETCLAQQEDYFYAKMWRYATCYDETDARKALGAKACVRKHGDGAMGHIQCWVAPSGCGTSDLLQTVYGEAFADVLDVVSLDFMSMPSLTLNSVDTLLRQVSQQWLSDHFCRRKVPITAITTTSDEEGEDDETLATHFVRTRIVIVPQLDLLLEDRQKSGGGGGGGGSNGSVTRHLDEATIDAIAHSIFRFLTNPAWQHCQVPIVFWITLHNQNAFRVRQLLRGIHHYTYLSSTTPNTDATNDDYEQQQWQRQTREAPLVHFHTPLAEDDAATLRREWLVRWMRCDLQRRRLEGWRQQAPPSLSSSSLPIDDSTAYWASLVVRQRWQHTMSLHYLLQWVDRVCDPVQWTHHQSNDANTIQTIFMKLANAYCQSMMPIANTTSDVGSMSVWLQQLNWRCIDVIDNTEGECESTLLVQSHSTTNHTTASMTTFELATASSSSPPTIPTAVFGLQWFCTAMAHILMPLTYECHLQLSTATTPSTTVSTATEMVATIGTMRKRTRHSNDATDDDNSMLPPNAKRSCLESTDDNTATDSNVQLPSLLHQRVSSLDPWRRALARLPFHQFAEQCRLNWTHLMLREEMSSRHQHSSSSSRPMACTRRMRNQRTAMTLRDVRALAQRIGLRDIIRLNEVMALIYDLRYISYKQRYAGGDMWRAFQSSRDDSSSEATMMAIEDGDDALFGIALLNAFFRDAQLGVSTLQMRNGGNTSTVAFNLRQEPHWQVTMTPEVQLAWIAKRVQWMRTPSSDGKKNNATATESNKSESEPPSLGAHWGGLAVEDWRALKQTSRLPSTLDSLDAIHRTPDFLQQNAAMALAFEYL